MLFRSGAVVLALLALALLLQEAQSHDDFKSVKEFKKMVGPIRSASLSENVIQERKVMDMDMKKVSQKTREMLNRINKSKSKPIAERMPTMSSEAIEMEKEHVRIKINNVRNIPQFIRNVTHKHPSSKRNYWDVDDVIAPFNSAPLLDDEDRFKYPYSAIGLVVTFEESCLESPKDGKTECLKKDVVISKVCTGSVIGDYTVFYPSWKFETDKNGNEWVGTSLGQWAAIAAYPAAHSSLLDKRYYGYCCDGSAVLVMERKSVRTAPHLTYDIGSVTGTLGLALGRVDDILSIVGYSWKHYSKSEAMGIQISDSPLVGEGVHYGAPSGIYPTDLIVDGAPAIMNLGLIEKDPYPVDLGRDKGQNTLRNVIVSVVTTQVQKKGDKLYTTASARFVDNALELAIRVACERFCHACPLDLLDNIDFTKAKEPTRPVPDVKVLDSTKLGQWERRAEDAKKWVAQTPTGKLTKKSLVTHSYTVNAKIASRFAKSGKVDKSQKKNYFVEGLPFRSTPVLVPSNRFVFPYTTIGKLFSFDEQNQVVATCTGVVMGPRMVFADPDCLRPDSTGDFHWTFHPSWLQDSFDGNTLKGTSLGAFEGESSYVTSEFDAGSHAQHLGVLIVKSVQDTVASWRSYTLGSITGWLGFDMNLKMESNMITQVAYSEDHFPGRLQVVSTTASATAYVAKSNGELSKVFGFATDMLHTEGTPAIINFGPFERAEHDLGMTAGGYSSRNVLACMAGISYGQLELTEKRMYNHAEGEPTNKQTYCEPFHPWLPDFMATICSASCGACDSITSYDDYELDMYLSWQGQGNGSTTDDSQLPGLCPWLDCKYSEYCCVKRELAGYTEYTQDLFAVCNCGGIDYCSDSTTEV